MEAVLKMWTPRQGSPRNLGLAVAQLSSALNLLDTRLLELARVPVRFDHVASVVVNANDGEASASAHHSGVG